MRGCLRGHGGCIPFSERVGSSGWDWCVQCRLASVPAGVSGAAKCGVVDFDSLGGGWAECEDLWRMGFDTDIYEAPICRSGRGAGDLEAAAEAVVEYDMVAVRDEGRNYHRSAVRDAKGEERGRRHRPHEELGRRDRPHGKLGRRDRPHGELGRGVAHPELFAPASREEGGAFFDSISTKLSV